MLQKYIKYINKAFTAVIFIACQFFSANLQAQGTVVQMVNGSNLTVDLCSQPVGTIVDDGGATGYYSNYFNGTVTLTAVPGVTITLTGSYSTESCCDHITVYDASNNQLSYVSGTNSLTVSTTSGSMKVQFSSDVSVTNSGFELSWSTSGTGGTCSNVVSGLTVSNITTNSAELAWNATDATGPFMLVVNGETADTNLTSTTYTLTGLNANTHYDVQVLSMADHTNRCCGELVSLRTNCGVAEQPLRESFEDFAIGSFPYCWTASSNFDAADGQPQVDGLHAAAGSKSLMLSCGDNNTSGHFGMVVSPNINIAGTHFLLFSMQSSHSYTAVVLGTCDSTSSEYDSYGFVPFDTIYTSGTGWYNYRVQFTAPAGASRLAWRMLQGMQNGVGRRVYIDDMMVNDCGILTLSTQHIEYNQMEVLWTTYGSPDVTIGIREAGADSDEQTFTAATSPLTITGLNAETYYELRAYPSCGGTSTVTAMTTAVTPQAPTSARSICLDFTSNYQLPEGWTSAIYGGSFSFYRYLNYNYSYYGGRAYIISPVLSDIGGTTLVISFNGEPGAGSVTLGTCLYDGDTTGFSAFSPTFYTDGSQKTIAFTVPTNVTGSHIAIRLNTQSYYSMRLHSLYSTECPVTGTRVTNTFGTTADLEWDTVPAGDTVLLSHWLTSSSFATAVTDTFVGINQVTVDGLSPNSEYFFLAYSPCHTPCPGGAVSATTHHADYPLPFCEDFSYLNNNDWSSSYGDWTRLYTFADCPRFSDQPFYYNAGKAIELSSFGFDWDYYNSFMLPMMSIDSGSILSFYAQCFAPQGYLELGFRRTTTYYTYNDYFDTIQLAGDGKRTHYTVHIPDSLAALGGQLTMTYRHNSQYSLYRCYIDELNIGALAYDSATVTTLYTDSVKIALSGVVADSVVITVYNTSGTLAGSYTFVQPMPDTVTLTGLSAGTRYTYYVQPMGDGGGCNSYAGYFTTLTPSGYIGGGGELVPDENGRMLPICYYFDDILSWELPSGWAFSTGSGTTAQAAATDDGHLTLHPNSEATIYASNRQNHVLSLRARSNMADDTLLIGLINAADMTYGDSLFSALPDGFVTLDTIVLDTAWHYFALTLPYTATSAKRVALKAGTDTLHLDNVFFSTCSMPGLVVEGSDVIFTSPYGGSTTNYVLNVTGDSGEVRYYHITTSPLRINAGFELNSTYDISWQCVGSGASCDPSVTLTTEKSISLPYCFSYTDFASSSVPSSWTFKLTAQGGTVRPDSWGPSLYLNSSNNRYQYAILPPFEVDSTLCLRINCYYYGELGVLDSGTDTSTFIPLLNLSYSSYYIDLSAYVGKRIAIRTNSTIYINSVQVYGMSIVHHELIGGGKVKVWTEADDDYWLEMYNNSYYNYHSKIHVSSNPDTINVSQNTNLYYQQLPEYATLMCYDNYTSFNTGRVIPLPYCGNFQYGSTSDIYNYSSMNMRYVNGSYYMYCPTQYSCYMTMHDMDVASLSEASLMLRYRCTRQGVGVCVGVLDNVLDNSTFTPVDTIYTDGPDEWHLAILDLATYTGTGRWLQVRTLPTSTYDSLFISNFSIEPCRNSMGSYVKLRRWNIVEINNEMASDSTTDFYVEYGYYGFTPGYGTIKHITTLPTYLTLTPETQYDFYFRCDSIGSSCTEMQRVKTLAAPLAVPSCTNFDNVTINNLPQSWTASSNNIVVTAAMSHTSNRSLRLPVSTTTLAITPDLDIDSIGKAALSLWMTADNPGSRLVVGAVTNINDGSTFHPLRSFGITQAGSWVRCMVDLSSLPEDARFIAFRTTSSTTADAGNIYIDDLYADTCGAFGLSVFTLSSDTAKFKWSQVGHPSVSITMLQGDSIVSTFTPDSNKLDIVGLPPLVSHTFYFASQCDDTTGYCNLACRDTVTIVIPGEGIGCIDATNFNSPQSTFFSGNFSNPYSSSGAINYGTDDPGSRHTVCYDTAERDPRTGGLLRTIPEGYTSSVRLGNWSTNAYIPEAEGVIYSLLVDTSSFELLLLRYAAVLQDPMHAAEDQPRFRMELLDTNFNIIDSACTSADFIADQSLGWNSAANGVLWKDWTAVGVDLSNHAGEQVYFRLTTFDCNEGSHYGYAYFTLECMNKNMQTETCGDVDSNTLSAPEGFNYRWYTSLSNTTVSTEQTITVPSEDITYYCEVSKIDNASCHFTINTYGGTRYPMASFDTTSYVENCHFHVRFNNTSAISKDGVTPMVGTTCETAYWDFGNGQTSNSLDGDSAIYLLPGTYTVTLVSGIANNECVDTATMTLVLEIPEESLPSDSIYATICDNQTYPFHGSTFDTAGTYSLHTMNYQLPGSTVRICDSLHLLYLDVHYTNGSDTTAVVCDSIHWHGAFFTEDTVYTTPPEGLNVQGCDSTVTLHLTVHYSDTATVVDTVVQNALPYFAADTTFILADVDSVSPQKAVGTWQLHTNTSHGCDSVLNLDLTVWLNLATTLDTAICRNRLPLVYHDSLFSPAASYSTHYVTLTSAHATDSVVKVNITVYENPTASYYDTVVENDLPHTFRSVTFNTHVDTTLLLLSDGTGCDTFAHYNLHVWYNRDTVLYRSICYDALPYAWEGYTFTLADVYDTQGVWLILHQDMMIQTTHGADSLLHLELTVQPIYDVNDTHIICPWRQFLYEGIDYGGPTQFDAPHLTVDGCDSLVHVVLTPRDSNYHPLVIYSTRDSAWLNADTIVLGCAPDTLTLRDTTDGSARWMWTFVDSDTIIADTTNEITINFQNHNHYQTPPNLYTLIVEDTNGCFDTLSHPVYIFRRPIADFGWSPAVPAIDKPEAQFTNQSEPLTAENWPLSTINYLWGIQPEPGAEYDTTTVIEPFYKWGEVGDDTEGDYEVRLISYWTQHATDTTIVHTCTDTATNIITITNDYLQFPNLVTPNGDGTNDIWRIVNLLEYGNYPINELWIYNQWGELVYHAKDIAKESDFWDPNNTASPDGTYFFRFTARSPYGLAKRNGIIEVLRD